MRIITIIITVVQLVGKYIVKNKKHRTHLEFDVKNKLLVVVATK